MADCMNGSEPKFTTFDTEQMESSAQAPRKSRRGLGFVCIILYFVLLTAVAVIAFIMGAYATDKVRSIREPDAVLVSDPSLAPAGYTAYSLGTGLGYWSPAGPMKYTRSDHGVLSYQKYAFLIGGLSNTDPVTGATSTEAIVLQNVTRYNTETGEVTEMAAMPERRYRFAYALLDGKIYVMGGTWATNGTGTDTVFIYDIAADKWQNQTRLQVPRIDACGSAVNGQVYVFGGYETDGWTTLNSMETYSPSWASPTDTDRFQLLPNSNLITSRGDCRAVAVDGLIYAMGGVEWYNNTNANCSASSQCYRFLNSVEAFNPSTQKWSSRKPMNDARGDFGIEVLGGDRIVVAGGERGDANMTRTKIAMYEVEEYVVQDDVWVQKAPLPQARFRDDLATVAGRVYAFGGNPTCEDSGGDDQCFKIVTNTVFTLFDVQYPRLYAFFKPAAEN